MDLSEGVVQTLGVLATVILLLVRELVSPKKSDVPPAMESLRESVKDLSSRISMLADSSIRLERMHDDADSKFSTVRIKYLLEHDVMRQLAELHSQASMHTAQLSTEIERASRGGSGSV